MDRNRLLLACCCILAVAVVSLFLLASSIRRESERLAATVDGLNDSLALARRSVDSLRAFTPGLGEYMSTIQLHITKLWFAGHALNWKLASYELGELDETMEAAGALHARKKSVDITGVLESVRQTQLPLLERSISQNDLHAFENAYGQTLAACNGCHRPAGYEFIHIITPTHEPVTNQQWKMDDR